MSANTKVYVIFYTTYGHIYKLVKEVVKGINAVDGTEAMVFQVSLTALSGLSSVLTRQCINVLNPMYHAVQKHCLVHAVAGGCTDDFPSMQAYVTVVDRYRYPEVVVGSRDTA